MGAMKRALKKLRASQPFNVTVTSTARALCRALGVTPAPVVRHLHRVGTVSCALPNGRVLKLWSRGDDWVSNQIYWKGLAGYEPETVSTFLKLTSCAGVTFDVGAYVGFYTVLAAHANPSGRVYAFEPHPDAYPRLLRNVQLNRLSNVECLHTAVSDAEGTADLYCGPGGLPTSSSLSLDFMKPHGTVQCVRVKVVALDEFVRERGIARVDLLKIDTESTEPQILRGMQETLRRDRPSIICEVLQGRGAEDRLEDILGGLGYRYYLLTPTGPMQVPKVKGHVAWLNYLFTCSEPGGLGNQSEGARRRASSANT
jgi:FkbM family methyltransferase